LPIEHCGPNLTSKVASLPEKFDNTSKLTFVTSFFHIYNEEYDENKTIPWRVERFREIASTGIHLCVYTCPLLRPEIEKLVAEFPDNVRLMKVMEISETAVAGFVQQYKIEPDQCPLQAKLAPDTVTQDCQAKPVRLGLHIALVQLPQVRNETKDVADYMIVINSKTEFMCHTISENPWGSTHFAWIDFNISHVFHDKPRSLRFLEWLGSRDYFEDTCFVIPGCWDKWTGEHVHEITDRIHWRFCGGFFLGDAASIRHFHHLYLEHFPRFMAETHTLVWEVNFWAWLEHASDWFPPENTPASLRFLPYKHTWYKADHNDTIICDMWARTFSRRLLDISVVNTTEYDYPKIDGYHASSAAYLFHEGEHWLNTRYVNYWYYADGWYMFYDGTNIIRSKNVLSKLSTQYIPLDYREISETIDLPSYEMYSRGIEDVRLYSFEGGVKYIATTVGYHSTSGNRMIVGNYNTDTLELSDSHLIEPPTDTFSEKNWVPLVLDNPDSIYHGRELFIYQWGPFEVGEISEDNHQLHIVYREDSTRHAPFFHKMKGSANFVDTGKVLVGVVHFSEELRPRHYFHVLVELDRTTLEPIRYSDPFYFDHVSIEFCIGFAVTTDDYLFWISRMDRDPLLVRVPIETMNYV